MKRIPFKTLLKKEINRFMSVWAQAIFAPVISVTLYMVIFGVSLGSRISLGQHFSYLAFILPGLIMIAVITDSAMNANYSIFLAKLHGSIFDVLVAPVSYLEMTVAYVLASIIRAFMVGTMIYLVGFYFSGLVPVHPLLVLLIAFLTSWLFAAMGAVIAIWAKNFDQLGVFNNFILTPLIFLGGVFYSLDMLPPFWQTVSKFNPMLYMVDSFRYAFLGVSHIPFSFSLILISALTAIVTTVLLWAFKSGWKLRS